MGEQSQMALYGVEAQGSASAPDLRNKAVTTRKDSFESLGSSRYSDETGAKDYRKWMREDVAVKSSMRYKIMAALARGWKITPGAESPEAERVADFVRDQFTGLDHGGNRFLKRALWAYPLGWSVHEIVYQAIEDGDWRGLWGLSALKEKKPETMRVVANEYGDIEALEQQQSTIGNDWKTLDIDYFVVFMPDHDGDWKPHSDLEAAKLWIITKELMVRFRNIYAEKFSMPTPVGKVPGATQKEDRDALAEELTRLHGNTSIVVGDGFEIDLLEATRRGGDVYQTAIEHCDRMIRLSVLVPSLTLEEGRTGAYSLGVQHAENFQMVLSEMGDDLTDIINRQVIPRLCAWNFTSADLPKFELNPFPNHNLKTLAETMALLVEKGVVPATDPFVRESLGLPEIEDGAPPAQPQKLAAAQDDPPAAADHAAPTGLAPLRHAAKADFAAYEKRLDEMEAEAVTVAARVTRIWLDHTRKWIRTKKLVENRDARAVDGLKFAGVGTFKDALARLLGHSVQWGVSDARDEIERGLRATKAGTLPDLKPVAKNNLFSEAEYSEMAAEHSVKEIVEYWQSKVPIQRDLLKHYDRKAFTIAGVHQDKLLRESKALIESGIVKGSSYKEIEAGLADLFNPYIEIDGAVDPGLADPYRIQTIVRTNMAEAYNLGRMNLYRDPEVKGFITAFEYSAVMDDRTTPFCAAWHGKVLKESAPELGTINPPNHFRCRSVLIPVVTGEKFEPDATLPTEKVPAGFAV